MVGGVERSDRRNQLRNRSVAGSQILAVSACHEEVLGPRQSNDQREQRGLPSGTMGLRVDAPKLRGSKTGCYQSLSLNPMGYNPRENIFRTNTRRRISGSPPRVKYSPELVTESVKLLDQNCDNTSRFEHRDKHLTIRAADQEPWTEIAASSLRGKINVQWNMIQVLLANAAVYDPYKLGRAVLEAVTDLVSITENLSPITVKQHVRGPMGAAVEQRTGSGLEGIKLPREYVTTQNYYTPLQSIWADDEERGGGGSRVTNHRTEVGKRTSTHKKSMATSNPKDSVTPLSLSDTEGSIMEVDGEDIPLTQIVEASQTVICGQPVEAQEVVGTKQSNLSRKLSDRSRITPSIGTQPGTPRETSMEIPMSHNPEDGDAASGTAAGRNACEGGSVAIDTNIRTCHITSAPLRSPPSMGKSLPKFLGNGLNGAGSVTTPLSGSPNAVRVGESHELESTGQEVEGRGEVPKALGAGAFEAGSWDAFKPGLPKEVAMGKGLEEEVRAQCELVVNHLEPSLRPPPERMDTMVREVTARIMAEVNGLRLQVVAGDGSCHLAGFSLAITGSVEHAQCFRALLRQLIQRELDALELKGEALTDDDRAKETFLRVNLADASHPTHSVEGGPMGIVTAFLGLGTEWVFRAGGGFQLQAVAGPSLEAGVVRVVETGPMHMDALLPIGDDGEVKALGLDCPVCGGAGSISNCQTGRPAEAVVGLLREGGDTVGAQVRAAEEVIKTLLVEGQWTTGESTMQALRAVLSSETLLSRVVGGEPVGVDWEIVAPWLQRRTAASAAKWMDSQANVLRKAGGDGDASDPCGSPVTNLSDEEAVEEFVQRLRQPSQRFEQVMVQKGWTALHRKRIKEGNLETVELAFGGEVEESERCRVIAATLRAAGWEPADANEMEGMEATWVNRTPDPGWAAWVLARRGSEGRLGRVEVPGWRLSVDVRRYPFGFQRRMVVGGLKGVPVMDRGSRFAEITTAAIQTQLQGMGYWEPVVVTGRPFRWNNPEEIELLGRNSTQMYLVESVRRDIGDVIALAVSRMPAIEGIAPYAEGIQLGWTPHLLEVALERKYWRHGLLRGAQCSGARLLAPYSPDRGGFAAWHGTAMTAWKSRNIRPLEVLATGLRYPRGGIGDQEAVALFQSAQEAQAALDCLISVAHLPGRVLERDEEIRVERESPPTFATWYLKHRRPGHGGRGRGGGAAGGRGGGRGWGGRGGGRGLATEAGTPMHMGGGHAGSPVRSAWGSGQAGGHLAGTSAAQHTGVPAGATVEGGDAHSPSRSAHSPHGEGTERLELMRQELITQFRSEIGTTVGTLEGKVMEEMGTMKGEMGSMKGALTSRCVGLESKLAGLDGAMQERMHAVEKNVVAVGEELKVMGGKMKTTSGKLDDLRDNQKTGDEKLDAVLKLVMQMANQSGKDGGGWKEGGGVRVTPDGKSPPHDGGFPPG